MVLPCLPAAGWLIQLPSSVRLKLQPQLVPHGTAENTLVSLWPDKKVHVALEFDIPAALTSWELPSAGLGNSICPLLQKENLCL